jgi:ABC-type amino acid transport substrate-binding protein
LYQHAKVALSGRRLAAIGGASTGAALLSTLALTTGAAQADGTTVAQIKQAGVITVGMAVDPPFGLQTASGQFYSFNPSLATDFAKYLGVKIKFAATTGTAMVAGLQSGQYEMLGASVSATPERKKAINFTLPYAYGGNSWIVSKSSAFTTLKSLNSSSATIAATADTFQSEATTTYMPKATLRSLPNASYSSLISELSAGYSEAISVPSFIAPAIVDKFPTMRSIPTGDKGVEATGVAWGIPKGDTSLLNAADAFMRKATKDGTVATLYKKYITLANALKS